MPGKSTLRVRFTVSRVYLALFMRCIYGCFEHVLTSVLQIKKLAKKCFDIHVLSSIKKEIPSTNLASQI